MENQLIDKDVKELSISELYHKVKLPKEVMDSILKQGDKAFEKLMSEKYSEMICKNCKWWIDELCKRDEPYIKKTSEDHCSIWEKRDKERYEQLYESYRNIQDLFKKYCDLKEGYYTLLPLWIIGTYIHKYFPTYPFLYFNAMRGGGKTRTLRLVTLLSKDGQILNSLTEAVLFRTKGTLGIDEFEGITRKGTENLRELLNSAYKKGIKVKRMKKMKTLEGEEQVVEEFDVYRPIAMANIWGIEEVLSDRSITLILEKSDRVNVVNLIEMFEKEPLFISAKNLLNSIFKENLNKECRLCHVVTLGGVYMDWNEYITYNNITTHTYNNIKQHILFDKIKKTGLDGRSLELSFPLILIADMLGEEVLDNIIKILSDIMGEKKGDFYLESKDISFIDFVSQYPEDNNFIPLTKLAQEFKLFLQEDESEERWINTKWIGRSLKRLNLIKKKKRMARGREVILDIEKALNKIRMFK